MENIQENGENRNGKSADPYDLSDLLGKSNVIHMNNEAVALDLAKRGFKVCPVVKWKDGEWKPIKGFPLRATDDFSTIKEWWRKYPHARVGLIAGARNGFVGLDIDLKNGKDGFASLRDLGFPDWTKLSPVFVQSPSGGGHIYFRYTPRVLNWAGKVAPGIDTRSTGGYLVAPESWKNGKQYKSLGARLGAVELPPFPESLIPEIKEREPVEIVEDATPDQIEWAGQYLESLVEELADAEDGTRNDTLNRFAMWAGGAAAHGFISEEDARSALESACEANGMKAREFAGTFRSGFEAGLQQPISDFPLATSEDDFDDLDDEPSEKPKGNLTFDRASDWAVSPAPPREWLIDELIPNGVVTMLNGDGGTGKSLVALQLAVAVASEGAWLGLKVERPGKALFLSAEDSKDELHRRLEGICGAELATLDQLLIRSLINDDPLLATFDKQNKIKLTGLFKQLETALETEYPSLVVLDTLADLHSGNENDRTVARQFIGKLKGLASRYGCAVLLLAHPSRAGMSDGSGASGSTGWNNSVRSRLYLTRVIDGEGKEWDDKARKLSTVKANYAGRQNEIDLLWRDGRFIVPGDSFDDLESREERAERVFLKLLDRLTAEDRYVSPNVSSTYAPAIFEDQPDAEGCTKSDFTRAMNRLFCNKRIQSVTHKHKGKERTHIEKVDLNASQGGDLV